MGLYSGRGDSGCTSLFDGTEVGKNDLRVHVLGQLDELNATLGWVRSVGGVFCDAWLKLIQQKLYIVCAEIAGSQAEAPSRPMLTADDCRQLETWIDETEEKNSPLKHFILPGGCELASRLHLARTCCRRAERYLVALDRASSLRPEVLVFMNRISDLLFALARQANHQASVEEEQAGGTA